MEKMKFEIKTKNVFDKRKWDVTETTNRLDVVRAIGGMFSPRQAEEMKVGKWYGLRIDVQVRVVSK
jgi:hypothetical protein